MFGGYPPSVYHQAGGAFGNKYIRILSACAAVAIFVGYVILGLDVFFHIDPFGFWH